MPWKSKKNKIKVFYSDESVISKDDLKILDARCSKVQSVPSIQTVHHDVPINVGTIDIDLKKKCT